MRFSSKLSLAVILLGVLLEPTASFAAAQEHAHHGSIADLIPYWVHFLIYVIALYYLVRQAVSSTWINRHKRIEADVISGRSLLENANKKLLLARATLNNLPRDLESLKAEIQSEAVNDSARIRDEATKAAERIRIQNKEAIERELKSVELRIRREVAELAVQMAKDRLKNEINVDSDRPLRTAGLGNFSGLLN